MRMGNEPIVSHASSDRHRSLAAFFCPASVAQGPLPKVAGCPYSYRSSGDYCIPSKNSKDAFIRTGNSCPNGYRKSGKYCIAN